MDEQEQTRCVLLSPETTQEKFREAIFLKLLRKGDPLAYKDMLSQYPELKILKERVKKVKMEKVRFVIIPFERVAERFFTKRKVLKPRHQRDIERIISLIQTLALLNLWHRKRDESGNIYADEKDVDEAFTLYAEIEESQELGLPPYVFLVYRDVIRPLYVEKNKKTIDPVGLTRREIVKKYFEVFGRHIPDYILRQEVLPALEGCGLICQEPDPDDRRRMLIFCQDTSHLPEREDRVLDALARVEKVDD
jgi:hypothetical protein